MAARSIWKGTLKLSLINIPIRVFPATNPSSDISFRQLHRKCHTPIELKRWCPHCKQEVDREDIVKGYEESKGQYLVVDEEDIAKLRPASTRVIELSHLVDADKVDPIHIERAYYLAPESAAAGPAFATIREALHERAAIGYLALHRREYLTAVTRCDDALILYTLRTRGEVKRMGDIEEIAFANARTKPAEVALAGRVLDSLEKVSDLSDFTDHYEENLKRLLETRGTAVAVPGSEEPPAKVVNLMEALRRSLEQAGSHRRQPASSAGRRATSRVVKHPSSRKAKAS